MKTEADIKNAKTSELVEWYNAVADKPVKKFTDRATAEKRCLALLSAVAALAEQTWADDSVPPVVHQPRAVKVVEPVVEESTEELTDEEFEAKMKAELAEAAPEVAKASNAAGIARSWNDPKVAEKRLTRNSVTVTWNGKVGEYKSVRVAFAALNLPDSKHIRFRMKLKEAGTAIFPWAGVEYTFSIV